jgi:hypothetical protein
MPEGLPEAYAAYAAGQREGVNEADAPLSALGRYRGSGFALAHTMITRTPSA